MISTPEAKANHRLARFVNKETAALLFHLNPEDIYRVECWQYVVYVHGKGISKFVSYCEFPPVVEVEPPTNYDFVYWRKYWRKKQVSESRKLAPQFWVEFFISKFQQAHSLPVLRAWGELIGKIKSVFAETSLQQLRESYHHGKVLLEHSLAIAS